MDGHGEYGMFSFMYIPHTLCYIEESSKAYVAVWHLPDKFHVNIKYALH